MRRYEHYKDSGIEWIGEIPKHWDKCRFKNFLQLKTHPSNNSNKVGLENIESGTGKFLVKENNFEGNGIGFQCNDILYGKLRPYLKKVWLADTEGNAIGDFFVFSVKENAYPKFVKWLLLSDKFTNVVNGSTYGAKMPRVSSNFMLSLSYYIPPFSEQRFIADYLDKRCGLIDGMIGNLQKKIELLKELKSSIISRVVTKGLDPHVKMRDSGIEWIGKIPEHWEKCRLKNLIQLKTLPSNNSNKIGLENIESGTGKFLVKENNFEGNGIGFQCNDILYGKLRPYLKKVWLADTEGNAIGDFFVFSVKENAYPKFVKWLLLSDKFTNVVDGSTYGAKMPRVSFNFMISLYCYIPPLSEQKSIADYLDDKCEKIDSVVTKSQRKIDLLKEYKTALISEVVTGKRKVSA
ncbi:restriction endonuclease subunit S [Prevotella cerevisiae]|uniref:Restriction endonuclease subunit S n=1 Tax=Segatella cerevisiae TaxID=2053716 RepID=A0ABT1BW97_9BACT|nr:restriction endonuclease subunit S [Segatella cerevisiae]MCO6024980.1 restriction endonuclease subunit S [Segatella cerevisiae]